MYNGADLKPIIDESGNRIAGAYAFGDRVVMRRRVNEHGAIVTKTWDAYARLDDNGNAISIFQFPVEADPEKRTVSRKATGAGSDLDTDLYLQKRVLMPDGSTRPAFRYATVKDMLAVRALARKNEIEAAKAKEAQNPMAQYAEMGKAIAREFAGATGSTKGQRAIGGANG